MKVKAYLFVSLLIGCLVTNACSQNKTAQALTRENVFYGSTPADEAISSLLTINTSVKIDFIKWNLTLNPITSNQQFFSLEINFGELQQNTLNFKGGGEKLSFKGTYHITGYKGPNFSGQVYHLKSVQLPNEILLCKISENVFHILTAQHTFMIGNAGWSYTLNRVNPDHVSLPSLINKPDVSAESLDSVVVFNGRTPCNSFLLVLTQVSDAGYQRIKWVLKLHRDLNTHLPTTFELKAVYVGIADSVYTKIGKWEEPAGTGAIILLKLNEGKTGADLALLKGDDHILFFLDKNRNPMVGNGNHSYTLNRKSN